MNEEAVKDLYYKYTGPWVLSFSWEELSEDTKDAWRNHYNRTHSSQMVDQQEEE